MKLTTKMIMYFLVVVIISGIGFGFVIYQSEFVARGVEEIGEQELPRLERISTVLYNVQVQLSSFRGYMLTGEERYIGIYKKASDENAKIEDDIIAFARNEELKKRIIEIKDLDKKLSDVFENKIVPLIREGKQAEAIALNIAEGVPIAEQLTKKAAEYKDLRTTAIHTALNTTIAAGQTSQTVSIYAAIISTIVGIGISLVAARSISKPINALNETAQKVADGDLTVSLRASSQDEIGQLTVAFGKMVNNLKQLIGQVRSQSEMVAAASEEVTASADQSTQASSQIAVSMDCVVKDAQQQLSAVASTNNTAESMTSELEEVSSNINLITNQAVKAAETAIDGGKAATKAIEQMKEVESTVVDSASAVAHLGERSKEIGQIVDTIAGIASQTNLLALNAAIEAARAGEQGRGFAVVAEEVRKLAEQSQEAAKKIAQLINEIQNETARAVGAMENSTREVKIGAEVVNATGVSFQEIVAIVEQVSERMQEISANVGSVAKGSEQIVLEVQNIDKLSRSASSEIQSVSAAIEEQSASMEEIAAASQKLSVLAQEMQGAVYKFKI